MTKRFIIIAAALLLAICLMSGGCSQVDDSKIKAWKDLIKIPTANEKSAQNDNEAATPTNESQDTGEKINVKLYFEDTAKHNLAIEERSIGKVEGIARQTMQELLKGPSQKELQAVFPDGTKLLDINIKPDGLCIVDLNGEAKKVSDAKQGKLMVQSVANTLGQFPTIKEVSFMINGEKVSNLGGVVDVTQPIRTDHSI